ncbi:DUF7002 family protein [Emcibacter nanhaiensis]|uniref:DUF4433 domain-containing protein n=1 Tax=Emcibacter nanhaiensis TaxID=1505037 RepID=A0A501PHB7_9PROT|nr:hypothetical protein [Emcibacter nanhaiensis]TPD59401.1 hypothetical protein FIV46_11445 [Emcibacter nanhaiensis]
MELEELYTHYPVLYHMAWNKSWPTIKKHGLLSTNSLLELYEIDDSTKSIVATQHRPECVTIQSKHLPDAVIRDQIPMTDKGVIRALNGTMMPSEWYYLLNSMVFFWPTKSRLKTMISAKAYRDLNHDVLIVRTEPLVKEYVKRLRISPINSGCTKPFAHPRSKNLFKDITSYPFSERKSKYGTEKAIAEVCFLDAIPNIENFVEDVLVLNADNLDANI